MESKILTPVCDAAFQDVDEALKRLPQEEVDARNQRLKRAMDLSLKHVSLEKDMQARQTPYLSYVRVCFVFSPSFCTGLKNVRIWLLQRFKNLLLLILASCCTFSTAGRLLYSIPC